MSRSPTSMVLTCMVGTTAVPVKPVTSVLESAGAPPRLCAARVVMAERLAPVSSTMR